MPCLPLRQSFSELGACPFGFRCRYFTSHVSKSDNDDEDGGGFKGTGYNLVYDYDKLRSRAPADITTDEQRVQWVFDTRGELNVVHSETIRKVRTTKGELTPITRAYLESIGEAFDSRDARGGPAGRGGGRGRGRGGRGGARGGARGGKVRQSDGGWGSRTDGHNDSSELGASSKQEALSSGVDTAMSENVAPAGVAQFATDSANASKDTIMDAPSNDQNDTPDVPLRPAEKRRLHFEGGLYLAPLTTVGNLPFRRLCSRFGADITCGEMGLSQEYITGNKAEWSLVRRHPSESKFGIQLCGNRPQTLVAATEILKKECPSLDFIDVNLGCPIDLVVKKGAGSALLDHSGKLGRILKGMNVAAGETPITIKMRTGVKSGVNTTHKMMSKAVKEWGVGALTVSAVLSFRHRLAINAGASSSKPHAGSGNDSFFFSPCNADPRQNTAAALLEAGRLRLYQDVRRGAPAVSGGDGQ